MYAKLLVLAALFFVLTPGVVVSLPPGASTLTVAATHALVFVVVYVLVAKVLLKSVLRR
jgi:hypothetical protein